MKKIMSMLLSVVMLFSITAGLDLSAYANTSGDWEYEVLDDGTAEITDYSGSAEALVIPSMLDGHTVTTIGFEAFYGCKSLTNVTIPEGVTSIDSLAFANCDNLTNVTIPASVTSTIDYGVFEHCYSLTSIDVNANNQNYSSQDGVLFDKNKTELILYPVGNERRSYSITSIGRNSFFNCSSLTNVTIPESVTSIGLEAFDVCSSLTSINVKANNQSYSSEDGVLFDKDKKELIQYPIGNERTSYLIPDGVITIGTAAFRECDGLTNVTIPNSVITIGFAAFLNCSSLAEVIIGNSVKTIENTAFSVCDSLTSIIIPSSVTSIGGYAFNCNSLVSIYIMNKNCDIFLYSSYTISETATIYGYIGSTAQEYAEEYGRKFVALDKCTTHKWDSGKVTKAATNIAIP